MTLPHPRSAPGVDAAGTLGEPPNPDALEERRFVRDRQQARDILAALLVPLAAFGVTDWIIAAGDMRRLAVMWAVRAVVLLALAGVWRQLGRTSTRAEFERLLFATQLVGVAISIGTHFGRGADTLMVTRFELLCVVGYYVAMPMRTLYQVIPAVSLSGVSLGMVFFWHKGVSGPQLVSHVVCFVLANALGLLLTTRRKHVDAEEEHAWRSMALSQAYLQKTIRELRALRGVVPICASCRKVRGEREAWQQLEAFVAARGDVEFSPILCPDCLAKEFGAIVVPPTTAP